MLFSTGTLCYYVIRHAHYFVAMTFALKPVIGRMRNQRELTTSPRRWCVYSTEVVPNYGSSLCRAAPTKS
jgi:hypothetical protein